MIRRGSIVTVPAIAGQLSSDDQAIAAGTTGRVLKATKQFVTLVTDDQRELVIRTDFAKEV